MTIKDLICKENGTKLGFALNFHLEGMKEYKTNPETHPLSEELYEKSKNMLKGMIQALLCVHTITDTEFMEIMEDIRKNY